MKMIIAILQPTKLDTVRDALAKLNVCRMTVVDAQGYGRQKGRTELFRGIEYGANLIRKVTLEIVVNDDYLDLTIDTLLQVAVTGKEGSFGDGKIFVLPVDEVVQVSDGTRGKEAV
ncbi:MAG: P-II family nitrogen regulator [Pirellulaceae bacterium]|nr:P-II family nitrogen regulator [Planctomycetaceae bacterium]HIM30928.1 P-II family nitrogen regulator [Planctomycetota bacterium]